MVLITDNDVMNHTADQAVDQPTIMARGVISLGKSDTMPHTVVIALPVASIVMLVMGLLPPAYMMGVDGTPYVS